MRILVGTEVGLYEFDPAGHALPQHHTGSAITALGAEYPYVWTILDGREVWRSVDEGGWEHKGTLEGLRANCIADTRAGYVVGTSGAHLYRVAGDGLERVDAFDEVDGRQGWYTPWGGPPDSRSITEDDGTVYVNVHVGGIVRTKDAGATWEPTIDIDADVHRVWADDRGLFAATAWGLAVSEDRGDKWIFRAEGLDATYCRAIGLCGDTVLVSASSGPGGARSAIYRGPRSGGALERCRNGLPDRFADNIDSYCLDAIPDASSATFGTADGRLFTTHDEGASWAEVVSGLPAVTCVLTIP